MLEISIENFLSFSEKQTFNMYAGGAGNIDGSLFELEYAGQNKELNKIKLFKASVIYGLNNAGKTNFFNALFLLCRFVEKSWENGLLKDDCYFKLNNTFKNKPTIFSITFITEQKIKYDYSFSFIKERIITEKLISYAKGQPQLCFERKFIEEKGDYDYIFKNIEGNSKNQIKDIVGATREDCLFLSAAKQYGNKFLEPVINFFKNTLKVIPTFILDVYNNNVKKIIEENDENFKKDFLTLLGDKSIIDIIIEKEPLSSKQILEKEEKLKNSSLNKQEEIKKQYEELEKRVVFLKRDENGNNIKFRLDTTESDGTNKLINLLSFLYLAKDKNKVLFFDELDCSLNSKLLVLLIKLIYKNNWKVQLIFTAHNTSLLKKRFDIFRKYQVWFVEKDYDNVSSILYSAGETSVRNEKDLEELFFNGRFIDFQEEE